MDVNMCVVFETTILAATRFEPQQPNSYSPLLRRLGLRKSLAIDLLNQFDPMRHTGSIDGVLAERWLSRRNGVRVGGDELR